MTPKTLYSGAIAAAFFMIGSLLLGSLISDYNPVSQTVSEIGQEGSPLYETWQVFNIVVGVLMMLFAAALISFANKNKYAILPGIFMLFYGISQFGIGLYPSPHSLHNVFGLSMTLGYFSPLVFALSWKNKLGKSFKNISILTFIFIIVGIFLNLTPAFAPTLYPLEYYGIVQRFLLFTFYAYSGYVSLRCVQY